MQFEQLNELVNFARQHSPYFKQHYSGISESITAIAELPLINPSEYWQNSQILNQWPVLTASPAQALVFKTGGSTSAGKLSVYTREEWHRLVSDFGRGLTTQFKPADRVANLFFAGDLYASFLFIHDALAYVAEDITEFPFTGQVANEELAEAIVQHNINVLAGVPAQLLTFASGLLRQGQVLTGVDTVLFGGESLFAAQRQILSQVFPNARIASIGYASVDAGFIGSSHRDCNEGEHRSPDGHALIEIIDEHTGELIDTCGRSGQLVLTNPQRRLMPLIRYPVGDRACWLEPVGTAMRKFALMGRSASSQRVRVGILSLIPEEIGACVQTCTASDHWQLLIEQAAHKDVLILKWVPAATSPAHGDAERALLARLIEDYSLIEQLQAQQLLELHIQTCTLEDLARHPRSGKCLRVHDLRRYDEPTTEAA
ncbi:phenylacetate--CoA ligase family protein [Pseudomonas atagonensis]|uniref:phenylacetate--CoA ligase family protein n=1 Tax=Pseudomonas atagonensis TaxID=2609964 RepID=UPI0014089797|nr:AMP-binding protein [Pseudomonas atagonensis]